MRIDGSHRSTKQFRRGVLELIALRGRALAKWSVAVEQFTLSPLPSHLEVDVVHDASFRGARPFFVRGDQVFQSGLQESPLGLVEKARTSLGLRSPKQRGGLACQRRTGNRD